ncbi:aspartic proteinase precursor [Pilatotrama ljubarskyi]|nr:aspartic proteinase precursor [Pilatotrama ljubarskyi]
MFTRLFSLVALCVAATAAKPVVLRDSPVTLPIARRFNLTGGGARIIDADQARAKFLVGRAQGLHKDGSAAQADSFSIPITNTALQYTVSVGVGTPPTEYNLVVDTGSANTWVGANKTYVQTNTSIDTGVGVEVSYGSGIFRGEEFLDTVTIGDLVIKNQSIGDANVFAVGFIQGVDGILGLGPTDRTVNTTGIPGIVPTVLDNAFEQGLIEQKLVGVAMAPSGNTSTVTNGELTIGDIDPSKFTGDLNYVPLTTTAPASTFVGIDQSLTYGSANTVILPTAAGIVDTGTTLILLASDYFAAYLGASGAKHDLKTGFLRINPDQVSNLQSLFFHIGNTTYEFTPDAQIWPRALNSLIGGDDSHVYLIIGDLGVNSEQGFNFVNGMTFLERFYHVFDAENNLAGFATTPFTNAVVN